MLLDTMLEVISKRNWSLEQFNDEFRAWLRFLMEIIDFNHGPQLAVKELWSSDHKIVGHYSAFIEDEVRLDRWLGGGGGGGRIIMDRWRLPVIWFFNC